MQTIFNFRGGGGCQLTLFRWVCYFVATISEVGGDRLLSKLKSVVVGVFSGFLW